MALTKIQSEGTDFDGNIGIGTTNPAELLHVDGTIRSGGDPNDGTDPGVKLLTTGLVQAARNSNSATSAVWMGYTENTATPTSRIDANGKGTFKNVIVADRSSSGDGCFHAALNGDVKASITSAGLITGTGAKFTGNVTPSSGEGVEIFQAATGVGQISSYDRTNSEWDVLRIKAAHIEISNNGSASEHVRITSGGNVGIGTSAPEQYLHIYSTVAGGAALELSEKVAQTQYNGLIQMLGNDMEIRGSAGNIEFYTGNNDGSSSTEKMRIMGDGTILINTTANEIGTSAFGARFSGSNVFSTSRDEGAASGVAQFFGNAGELRVMGDGDCLNTNNSYGSLSDVKLKENIVDANSQWNDVKALKIRNYNFKESTGFSTHKQIGLIAQEVESISPGLVSEENDSDSSGNDTGTVTKSVNYSVLNVKVVKALQEAMAKIETLETKVAALEAA